MRIYFIKTAAFRKRNARQQVLREKTCLPRQNGLWIFKGTLYRQRIRGIFWSLNYDGTPLDTTKHTYNQAFCIYALSSYYDAAGDKEALELAFSLFDIIEERCTDEIGYLEAFTNEILNRNQTKSFLRTVYLQIRQWIHCFMFLKRIQNCTAWQKMKRIGKRLMWIRDTFADKVYKSGKTASGSVFDAD